MDIHQLRTFVVVAREGSITRASERLHLSQPAVSAHIKAIEEALELTLFERTARGMSLTADGQRLLARAEHTLAAHQELMEEARRLKGRLSGRLRLGAGSSSRNAAVGQLVTGLARHYPEVEVALEHGTSVEMLAGIRHGTLDAGFYNEAGEPPADLAAVEVSRFRVFLVAARGSAATARPLDWHALAEVPWIYPAASACCARAAEDLFAAHHVRPRRTINVDREDVTRNLVASGLGVGLLHADTAEEAEARGEVERLAEAATVVRVMFAHLASRAKDPLLAAAVAILRAGE